MRTNERATICIAILHPIQLMNFLWLARLIWSWRMRNQKVVADSRANSMRKLNIFITLDLSSLLGTNIVNLSPTEPKYWAESCNHNQTAFIHIRNIIAIVKNNVNFLHDKIYLAAIQHGLNKGEKSRVKV